MTTKEEALRNVINDLKKKLKDFEEEYQYYAKKIREHEVLIDSHRQLIEHLEATTNWSLSALSMDKGGIGFICKKEDVHYQEEQERTWWKRFFGG